MASIFGPSSRWAISHPTRERTAALTLDTAAATAVTLDWAKAAAAAVMAPEAWAFVMAWVSRSATTVAFARSTVAAAAEDCSRRREAFGAFLMYFFATEVRTARSAAAVKVLPEMRAVPWARVVWTLALAAITLAA